jgi:hypothetical protein
VAYGSIALTATRRPPPGSSRAFDSRDSRRDDRAIEESQRETLDRLQANYVGGALSAEDYARLRDQVLTGTQAQPYTAMPPHEERFVPAGTDRVTGAPLELG